MSQQLDQIISKAFRENPIQGALLGVLLDGGRVISTGEISESLLNMFPDLFFFEKRTWGDFGGLTGFQAGLNGLTGLTDLTERDLVFVENLSVDELWNLAHQTGAQIARIGESSLDPSLADYFLQEKDLRSALMGLGPLLKQAHSLKDERVLTGARLNPALFLDRDGVVLEDVHYLSDVTQVRLRHDVAECFQIARQRGHRIFIVSNQSGLGRGMLNWDQYEAVTLKMQELLAAEGVFVDRILKAPFFEGSSLALGLVRRSLRKPRPGMIHLLVSEFRVDLSRSTLVGDCATDLMAGVLAGVSRNLLLEGPRREEELKKWREWPLLSRTSMGVRPPVIRSLKEIFSD
jgi:histidinol-phosphate phosphatase family protein